jgi:branched-chain amino acid aminotransferase
MLLAEHVDGQGWTRPLISPFGYMQVHPAAQVLHYGMTCFEGMKAYRGADGLPRLFRPELNMARLARSARRLQLAPFDPQELLECIKSLIKVDSGWLPSREGHSLYLRPYLFSSAHVLGVAKATRTTLSTIMSPVGPYFPSGLRPISLFVEERATRAWPGGVGQFKIGGNYAPTIQPQVQAAASHGAHQVVYTFNNQNSVQNMADESDDAVFEECGAMNIFFLIEKKKRQQPRSSGGGGVSTTESSSEKRYELVTPSLERGTILPGITRDSILSLTRDWGEFDVSERHITVREIRQAAAEGRLCEVFGSGTACIVQPVGALVRGNGEMWQPTVSDPADPRALAPRLQRALLDIQYGRVPNHPWSVVIK